MDIGDVVRAMKKNPARRFARKGWNGKNMYIQLQVPDEHSKMTLPYIYIRTAQGGLVPWLCSQTDIVAEDYYEVPATEGVVTKDYVLREIRKLETEFDVCGPRKGNPYTLLMSRITGTEERRPSWPERMKTLLSGVSRWRRRSSCRGTSTSAQHSLTLRLPRRPSVRPMPSSWVSMSLTPETWRRSTSNCPQSTGASVRV